MEYGINVNNKFALFANEDEDPLEVLQRTQQEAAEKKAKNAAKENSKVAAKNDKNASKTAKPAAKPTTKVLTPAQDQKAKTAPATSTTQPPRRENVVEKPPRFQRTDNANQQRRPPPPRDGFGEQPRGDVDFSSRPERADDRGGFPPRRGRGGRGGSADRGEGFDRFGKRMFERHSGSDKTGLKPVEKREGGGAHNWGSISDTVDQEVIAATETTAEQPEGEAVAAVTGDEAQVDAEAPAEPEEEERQLTLDEWKALQQQQKPKTQLNLRKPGEGCNPAPEWKKMFVLKKKVEEEGEEEEEEEEEDEDARSKQKQQCPIQIRFNDAGSRGGRGRGRGGRGGRGGRQEGDRPRRQENGAADAVPNVDNLSDFPSLG